MSDQFEKVIQFLVCPQNDFIDKLERGKHKKNKLHIKYQGALKLRGAPGEPDFFVETVQRFYDDKICDPQKYTVVIDEDWHPKSCHEFPIFGEHCVKGTEGAELPEKLEQYRYDPRTVVIRANSINIASDQEKYIKTLKEICGDTRAENIRVGVMGVWTHVKVEYLMINLHTLWPRIKFEHIAVCEPLCASPEKSDHNAAIRKFKEDYKINVFENIDDYCIWLGLNSEYFETRLSRHNDESADVEN